MAQMSHINLTVVQTYFSYLSHAFCCIVFIFYIFYLRWQAISETNQPRSLNNSNTSRFCFFFAYRQIVSREAHCSWYINLKLNKRKWGKSSVCNSCSKMNACINIWQYFSSSNVDTTASTENQCIQNVFNISKS